MKKEIEEICDDESTKYVFGVDDDFREIVPRLSNKHVCTVTLLIETHARL